MDYTHLGRSGLSVSRLCLGTMNFGPLTPPDEAHAIMDHAHELGINFFDTANRYGRPDGPPRTRPGTPAGPRRSSATGSPGTPVGVSGRSSRPSSTARWGPGRT